MAKMEIAATVTAADLGIAAGGAGMNSSYEQEMLSLTREIRDTLLDVGLASKKSSMFGGNGGIMDNIKQGGQTLFYTTLSAIGLTWLAEWAKKHGEETYGSNEPGAQELTGTQIGNRVAANNPFKLGLDDTQWKIWDDAAKLTGKMKDNEEEMYKISEDQIITDEEAVRLATLETEAQGMLNQYQTLKNEAKEHGVILDSATNTYATGLNVTLQTTLAIEEKITAEKVKQAKLRGGSSSNSGYTTSGETYAGASGRAGMYDVTSNSSGQTYSGYNESYGGTTQYVGIRTVSPGTSKFTNAMKDS